MTDINVIKSHEASKTDLVQLRALLDVAFDQRFTDDDCDHALGGWHAIIAIDGVPISHAAVVAREIEIGGQPLQSGYVEAVATGPASRARATAHAR
jgi:aminoglycoside 2'-N-acetyltransferase I